MTIVFANFGDPKDYAQVSTKIFTEKLDEDSMKFEFIPINCPYSNRVSDFSVEELNNLKGEFKFQIQKTHN